MEGKCRSTVFGHCQDGLLSRRGGSGRPGTRCNPISEDDIGPEGGRITMLGGGYGEMSVNTSRSRLPLAGSGPTSG
jgi:hypothetical protein